MSLFQWGNFKLHSGEESWWRIDCDSLSESEIHLFVEMIRKHSGEYHAVVAPSSHPGSSVHKLKSLLNEGRHVHSNEPRIYLAIDDVLTTGASMERIRKGIQDDPYNRGTIPEVKGFVLFARSKCPDWITPIFQLGI